MPPPKGDSALDRVNVARLLSHLESTVAMSLQPHAYTPYHTQNKKNLEKIAQDYIHTLNSNVGLFSVGDISAVNVQVTEEDQSLCLDVYVTPHVAANYLSVKFSVNAFYVIDHETFL